MNVTKGSQGFASMSPARQLEIASAGGRAAHAKGTAHQWGTGDEAKRAARKGAWLKAIARSLGFDTTRALRAHHKGTLDSLHAQGLGALQAASVLRTRTA